MARMTPFSPGQRWYVERKPFPTASKPNFWFVVLGAGATDSQKLCLVKPDFSTFAHELERKDAETKNRTRVSEYSRSHLKKCATLVSQTHEEMVRSHEACCQLYQHVQPVYESYFRKYAASISHRSSFRSFDRPDPLARHSSLLESLANGQPLSDADIAWIETLREENTLHQQAQIQAKKTASPKL